MADGNLPTTMTSRKTNWQRSTSLKHDLRIDPVSGLKPKEEAVMDIVLLEGLSPLKVNLEDAVRDIIGAEFPESRIWMLPEGHDFLYEGPPVDLERVARGFLDHLLMERKTDEERQRPIIFLGIAVGGVLVEQAVFLSHITDKFRLIRKCLAGVVFIGTPHGDDQDQGYGQILARLAAGSRYSPETTADGLSINSKYLQQLRSFFCKHIDDVPVCTITHPDLLVGKQSASIGCKGEVWLALEGPCDRDGHLSILQEAFQCIRTIERQHKIKKSTEADNQQATPYPVKNLPPDTCPICSTMPHDIPVGPERAPLEHTINLTQPAQEELRLWSRRCILANFAYRASIDWLGHKPAGVGRGIQDRERTLWGNISCLGRRGIGHSAVSSYCTSYCGSGIAVQTLGFKRPILKPWWWTIATEQGRNCWALSSLESPQMEH
ncbi:hypothetical protein V8F20_010818 [Naviculisporaceae sp. PSN 640]